MIVLFDTDILLQRESDQILSEELTNLLKMFEELKYTIFVHELSLEEVRNNSNNQKSIINLSKLKAYNKINNNLNYKDDENYTKSIKPTKEIKENNNNQLIYVVYKNIADYFITEDKDILNKAEALHLDKKILNINEALVLFKSFLPNYKINILPCFKEEKGYNLDLGDSIFNSLKQEYPGFDNWWKDRVLKRTCYVYLEDRNKTDKVKAILVPKIEEKEVIDCFPELCLEKCVKICLFKVADHGQGLKLGERLLSMAFDFAITNNVNTLYLTHFTIENDYLVKLIEEYGFYKHGKNKIGEEIFVKHIVQNKEINGNKIELLNANQEYFPSFYDGPLVNKHVVPIYPGFHDKLFPDYKKTQLKLPLNNNSHSEGNCIKKAYICNSPTRKVKKGDILLFYRTGDEQCITSLGVVDEVHSDIRDTKTISNIVFKRTVYNYNELEEKARGKNPILIILFKHHLHFSNVFTYKDLLNTGIVTGTIQTITEISDTNYNRIIKGKIDERFIINQT